MLYLSGDRLGWRIHSKYFNIINPRIALSGTLSRFYRWTDLNEIRYEDRLGPGKAYNMMDKAMCCRNKRPSACTSVERKFSLIIYVSCVYLPIKSFSITATYINMLIETINR